MSISKTKFEEAIFKPIDVITEGGIQVINWVGYDAEAYPSTQLFNKNSTCKPLYETTECDQFDKFTTCILGPEKKTLFISALEPFIAIEELTDYTQVGNLPFISPNGWLVTEPDSFSQPETLKFNNFVKGLANTLNSANSQITLTHADTSNIVNLGKHNHNYVYMFNHKAITDYTQNKWFGLYFLTSTEWDFSTTINVTPKNILYTPHDLITGLLNECLGIPLIEEVLSLNICPENADFQTVNFVHSFRTFNISPSAYAEIEPANNLNLQYNASSKLNLEPQIVPVEPPFDTPAELIVPITVEPQKDYTTLIITIVLIVVGVVIIIGSVVFIVLYFSSQAKKPKYVYGSFPAVH